jgi:hypothetical protein
MVEGATDTSQSKDMHAAWNIYTQGRMVSLFAKWAEQFRLLAQQVLLAETNECAYARKIYKKREWMEVEAFF